MMSRGLVKDEKARSLLEIKTLKMETAEHQDKHGPYLSNRSCMIVHVTHLERPALLPKFKNKRRSHWKNLLTQDLHLQMAVPKSSLR